MGVIEHYEEALARVCEAAGKRADTSVLAQLTQEYRVMTARVFEEVAPEIIEMLSDLKESGLVLGVVTNASDLDVEPWSSSVLAPYFDAFVASYYLGLAKPDPRIYYLACLIGQKPHNTSHCSLLDRGDEPISELITAAIWSYHSASGNSVLWGRTRMCCDTRIDSGTRA